MEPIIDRTTTALQAGADMRAAQIRASYEALSFAPISELKKPDTSKNRQRGKRPARKRRFIR